MTTHARAYQTLRAQTEAIRDEIRDAAGLLELLETEPCDRIILRRLEQMSELAGEIVASSGRLMRGLEGSQLHEGDRDG